MRPDYIIPAVLLALTLSACGGMEDECQDGDRSCGRPDAQDDSFTWDDDWNDANGGGGGGDWWDDTTDTTDTTDDTGSDPNCETETITITWMAASRGDGLNLQAATDAELWIMPDQWSDDPADEEEGLLSTSLSGSVTRCVGDENRVQVEFMNYFDVPQDFSGQWWACAYLYGEPTYWGTFQIDGVITEPTLIERDYDEDGTFDGVECLL